MSELFSYNWFLKEALASFQVDLEYAGKFDLLGDYTTLLCITCLPADPEREAFSRRERALLVKAQKTISRLLGSSGVFVGLVDVPAKRQLFYYTNDARLLLSINACCEKERRLTLTCTRVNEPDRQTYYTLLYPDQERLQGVENARLIAAMAHRGDNCATPRRINFHLRFSGAPAMQRFADLCREEGYAIGNMDFIPERDLPHGLSVHTIQPLVWMPLTAATTGLIRLSATCEGMLEYVDCAFIEKRF